MQTEAFYPSWILLDTVENLHCAVQPFKRIGFEAHPCHRHVLSENPTMTGALTMWLHLALFLSPPFPSFFVCVCGYAFTRQAFATQQMDSLNK